MRRREGGGAHDEDFRPALAAASGSEGEGEVSTRVDVNRVPKQWIGLAVAVTVLAGVRVARADAPPTGFIQPAPTVQHRIYTLNDKWEVGVMGAISLSNVLTSSDGAAITVDKQFGEYFALELLAGGGFGGVTNLVSKIRQTGAGFAGPANDLPNAGALDAYAQLGVRLTPFYGKFTLAAELPVHFDFYLNLGVGLAYVSYNSVLGCNQDTGGSQCASNDYYSKPLPTVGFNGGGGLRLFITQLWTIKVEVRDMVYPDRYYTNINFFQTQTSNSFSNNNLKSNPGLTQVPMVFFGLGWLL